MSTLIERLVALGFKPEKDDDEEHPDYLAPVGYFNIQVSTHEWKWVKDGSLYGISIEVPRNKPWVRLFLHHSCDEWVVADSAVDTSTVDEAATFAHDAQAAHDLLAQVVAMIEPIGTPR